MLGRVMFNRIMNQERTPVFTAISFFTTVCVEVVIIMSVTCPSCFRTGGGLVVEWSVVVLALAVLGGLVVNLVVGGIAANRGEYLGMNIALMGMLVWILKVIGSYAVGHVCCQS
jgi:hypothetical protein